MKILAFDLGKFKSVYVMYFTESKEQSYGKIGTNARKVEALLRRCAFRCFTADESAAI